MDMAQATYRFINFGYLRTVGYKTDNELTAFFAIDFGSMNFNHAAQIQDILWVGISQGTVSLSGYNLFQNHLKVGQYGTYSLFHCSLKIKFKPSIGCGGRERRREGGREGGKETEV